MLRLTTQWHGITYHNATSIMTLYDWLTISNSITIFYMFANIYYGWKNIWIK